MCEEVKGILYGRNFECLGVCGERWVKKSEQGLLNFEKFMFS